jgi:hypothetical protein
MDASVDHRGIGRDTKTRTTGMATLFAREAESNGMSGNAVLSETFM